MPAVFNKVFESNNNSESIVIVRPLSTQNLGIQSTNSMLQSAVGVFSIIPTGI